MTRAMIMASWSSFSAFLFIISCHNWSSWMWMLMSRWMAFHHDKVFHSGGDHGALSVLSFCTFFATMRGAIFILSNCFTLVGIMTPFQRVSLCEFLVTTQTGEWLFIMTRAMIITSWSRFRGFLFMNFLPQLEELNVTLNVNAHEQVNGFSSWQGVSFWSHHGALSVFSFRTFLATMRAALLTLSSCFTLVVTMTRFQRVSLCEFLVTTQVGEWLFIMTRAMVMESWSSFSGFLFMNFLSQLEQLNVTLNVNAHEQVNGFSSWQGFHSVGDYDALCFQRVSLC